jgi:DNA-directed RNA polymerase subunit RPC12/RpoP
LEEVVDLATHLRRLCDPDAYRPSECPSCGHRVLHVHDRRDRIALGDPETATVTVLVYLCAGCGGTWRILPRFVARHLWRTWRVVESQTIAAAAPSSPAVPARTRRRWHERLRSSARGLVVLLATSGSALLAAVVHALGLDATRAAVVAAYTSTMRPTPSHPLADLAALVDRLRAGVRVM